ncbi:hypothetical protein ANCDUO_18518, partial [Ancylostoma duodenale]
GMSVTPPLSEQLPRTNKFKGEAFGIPTNTRTIYAGSEDGKVILLVGPQTAGKSSLIDFLCNYFYGAELEKTTRYHIANEKFDSTTPEKQIITYVFNDTKMDVRPVVIDTPSTSGAHAEENREIMARWLKENEKLKIDAIGVVFSAYQRMTASEEEHLQKALAVFPEHLQSKRIVFITGSDGSSPPVGMLRRCVRMCRMAHQCARVCADGTNVSCASSGRRNMYSAKEVSAPMGPEGKIQ